PFVARAWPGWRYGHELAEAPVPDCRFLEIQRCLRRDARPDARQRSSSRRRGRRLDIHSIASHIYGAVRHRVAAVAAVAFRVLQGVWSQVLSDPAHPAGGTVPLLPPLEHAARRAPPRRETEPLPRRVSVIRPGARRGVAILGSSRSPAR